MGKEIERKFLVKKGAWSPQDPGTHFKQGYLNSQKERVVRVRIEGTAAKLTIKGLTTGATRSEFEYPLPIGDAEVLLDQLCEQPLIDKHRHIEHHGGHTGDNEGLVVAEVELASESEAIAPPPWAGEEVTHDPRYFNSNLLKHPYRTWRAE
jgi:adenylate cyclase